MEPTTRQPTPRRTFRIAICTFACALTAVSCQKDDAKKAAPQTPRQTVVDPQRAQLAVANALGRATSTLPEPSAAKLPFSAGRLPARELTAGRRGTYLATDSGLRVTLRTTTIDVPLENFAACSDEDAGPNRRVNSRATTWLLEGPLGDLGLRFGAEDIALLAYDDSRRCTRHAVFTYRLTGHSEPFDGALFDPGRLGLDGFEKRGRLEADPDGPASRATIPASESRGTIQLEVSGTGATASRADGSALRLTSPAPKTSDWKRRLVWATDAGTDWLRLVATSETGGDSDVASGSESSATIMVTPVIPDPTFVRTATWSTPSREIEDGRERVRRVVPVQNGYIVVDTERAYFDGAKMIGAGKCPEMEGVVDIEWKRVETTWRFVGSDGTSLPLGNGQRTVLDTSACLDAVAPDFGSRPQLTAAAVPDFELTWHSQPPDAPEASAN